jgi:hypothetical protein
LLVFGLDNQHITYRRNSFGTAKSRCSLPTDVRSSRIKKTGIATRSKTPIRNHLKTKVTPLERDVFASIKKLSIIVFIEIDVYKFT